MNQFLAISALLGIVILSTTARPYSYLQSEVTGTVECGRHEVSPGQFKFTCEDINAGAIDLQSEHVLWIQQDGGKSQLIDVEIPNYKIDELIKAGFKNAPGGGTKVNVVLKHPEQNHNAEVSRPHNPNSQPSVSIQYEPVQNKLVHYPNDKPYRPISSPITPPGY